MGPVALNRKLVSVFSKKTLNWEVDLHSETYTVEIMMSHI
jgi:hypothetical protein